MESCEGRGYATEAAQCARAHAFGVLGWSTAVSYIAAENVASKRVAARLGASRDGSASLLGKPVEVWRHNQQ
jgi:RimJ/RimL family protein N-acetyltransferase